MSDQPVVAGESAPEAEKAGGQGGSREQNSCTVQYRRGLFRERESLHMDSKL